MRSAFVTFRFGMGSIPILSCLSKLAFGQNECGIKQNNIKAMFKIEN
jgi:hypothetical protein